MLRRLGTLAVAIVLAAMPSLNRICLTGCHAAQSAQIRAEQSRSETVAPAERIGDKNCPLHASRPSPEPPAKPDVPAGPSPCRHQQELASADSSRARGGVLDSSDSSGIFTAAAIAGPTQTVVNAPIAHPPQIAPHPSSHLSVLRI
jgi:hypothetical protein